MEYIGIRFATQPGDATLLTLNDYDGNRCRVAVGERHVNRRAAELDESLAGPAVKPQLR